MIDGRNIFDLPEKNDVIAHEIIWKIATDHGDVYTTGYLLDYPFFKKY